MYINNHYIQDDKKTSTVPVQTFGDSFSADAYMKDMKSADVRSVSIQQSKETVPKHVEEENNINHYSESNHKKKILGLDFEDLLLIGLLLLYMSDDDRREDKIIPVILSVLLFI